MEDNESRAPLPQVEAAPVQPAVVEEKSEPLGTSGQGKGGYQHRLVQSRIREVAVARGFHATLEKSVEGSRETVDVSLERPGLRIACEISVSTTIDHEFGNVQKCLRAGYDIIRVITASDHRLKQIAAAVAGHLDRKDAAKVKYFTPAEFITFIQQLPDLPPEAPVADASSERTLRGRKVKRKFTPMTAEEHAIQSGTALRILAAEMRLPPLPESAGAASPQAP